MSVRHYLLLFLSTKHLLVVGEGRKPSILGRGWSLSLPDARSWASTFLTLGSNSLSVGWTIPGRGCWVSRKANHVAWPTWHIDDGEDNELGCSCSRPCPWSLAGQFHNCFRALQKLAPMKHHDPLGEEGGDRGKNRWDAGRTAFASLQPRVGIPGPPCQPVCTTLGKSSCLSLKIFPSVKWECNGNAESASQGHAEDVRVSYIEKACA